MNRDRSFLAVIAAELPPPSESALLVIRRAVQEIAGLDFGTDKGMFIYARLAPRLRELGLDSFDTYLARLRQSPGEMHTMAERLCIHETRFFRERAQLDHLDKTVFPRWARDGRSGRRTKRVRVWSAGCATGEEAFTFGMLLLRHFPPSTGWVTEIIATDLSTPALDRARRAEWPIDRADEIPEHLRNQWMLRGYGVHEGTMKATPELRAAVTFHPLNLADSTYAMPTFDIVACRNVLIYFGSERRVDVMRRLLGHVQPGGLLLLGHSEWLDPAVKGARAVLPTVYQREPSER